MKKILEKIKNFIIKVWKHEYFRAFLYIYVVGLLCFGIVAFRNDFTIPMSGDYQSQTYNFYAQGYHLVRNFFRTGEFPLFDFSNFLGANFLGTQSFYYAYSPLFYLLIIWPEKLLYQGIFFHMVFKFAVGGFFMYILLRRYFHVSKLLSWAGGFIYAFSGWTLFYLWFHFGDVMAFLPLMLIGFERCLQKRKGGVLTLGIFLIGLSNYFFLVNFLIFGMFYAIYRWIYLYGASKKRGYDAKTRWGVLLQGILFSAAGIALTAICLLPSLTVAQSANRTKTSEAYTLSLLRLFFNSPSFDDGIALGGLRPIKEILSASNFKNIINVLFHFGDRNVGTMKVESLINVGYILNNWVKMNTNCWDIMLYDNAKLDNSIGGFFITTPLTMLLVPTIVKTFKNKRPWAIFGLIVCLFMPFIPFTAHFSFAFTSLYGRWQIWIVVFGLLYIIPTLDDFDNEDRRLVTVNLLLNLTISAIAYGISYRYGKLPTNDTVKLFGKKIPEFILLSNIELIATLVIWFVYRFKLFKASIVKRIMVGLIVVEIGASTVITIENKGYSKWNSFYLAQDDYAELGNIIKELKKEDPSFYRLRNLDETRVSTNMPSALNYNSASCFNSTYDFELQDFINRSKSCYNGSWTFGNHEKRYWYDQYIGVKYYIIDKDDINNDNMSFTKDETVQYDGRTRKDEEAQKYNLNIPFGYEFVKSYEYYDLYVNTHFHGIGYGVDGYIEKEDGTWTGNLATEYEEMYTKYAIVNQETSSMFEQKGYNFESISSYNKQYKMPNAGSIFDFYFSPREDISNYIEKNKERQKYKVSSFTESNISSLLPSNSQISYGQRLHSRYTNYGYFGDQFIYELKEGQEKLAPLASSDNIAYITLGFKIGPNALISLYSGDTLVTQDAHMISNHAISETSYEWKSQRGFYVDKPIDKIVIEFITDATFNKVFTKSGSLPTFNITVDYQNEMNKLNDYIEENMFKDVTYKKNKFTFTSNQETNKIGITNIPYDSGWTLKVNGNVKDIFKVNGGFVGFIVPIGETKYELSYFTPNLKKGLVVSFGGLLMYIVLAFIYRRKEIDILTVADANVGEYVRIREEKEQKEVDSLIKKIKSIFRKKK